MLMGSTKGVLHKNKRLVEHKVMGQKCRGCSCYWKRGYGRLSDCAIVSKLTCCDGETAKGSGHMRAFSRFYGPDRSSFDAMFLTSTQLVQPDYTLEARMPRFSLTTLRKPAVLNLEPLTAIGRRWHHSAKYCEAVPRKIST